MLIVFGGSRNKTLDSWMHSIAVDKYDHAVVTVESIDPSEMRKSAEWIRKNWQVGLHICTVGKFADRILIMADLDHGALPSTTTRNKRLIEESLVNCKNYLLRRMYYAPTRNSPVSS